MSLVCNCDFDDGECQAPEGCRAVKELAAVWPLVSELRAEIEHLNSTVKSLLEERKRLWLQLEEQIDRPW
jgi:hypothetical protein